VRRGSKQPRATPEAKRRRRWWWLNRDHKTNQEDVINKRRFIISSLIFFCHGRNCLNYMTRNPRTFVRMVYICLFSEYLHWISTCHYGDCCELNNGVCGARQKHKYLRYREESEKHDESGEEMRSD
jgi:hypothetical protein